MKIKKLEDRKYLFLTGFLIFYLPDKYFSELNLMKEEKTGLREKEEKDGYMLYPCPNPVTANL